MRLFTLFITYAYIVAGFWMVLVISRSLIIITIGILILDTCIIVRFCDRDGRDMTGMLGNPLMVRKRGTLISISQWLKIIMQMANCCWAERFQEITPSCIIANDDGDYDCDVVLLVNNSNATTHLTFWLWGCLDEAFALWLRQIIHFEYVFDFFMCKHFIHDWLA